MDKEIILVHGRNFKPPKEDLYASWREALLFGIGRDFPEKRDQAEAIPMHMAYYGNISNTFLTRALKDNKYDQEKDVSNRAVTLEDLTKRERDEFFEKHVYDELPGKSSKEELFADLFSGALDFFNVADDIIERVAPDVEEYWNPDSKFGSEVRWPLTELLRDALEQDKQVALITHSLGTMIAYDVLWKFSYYGEYQQLSHKKVDLLVTLGSPLGNPTVQDNLKGAGANGRRRYPSNISKWVNLAAEDDYISHDGTLEDDFESMVSNNMVDSVEDRHDPKVYNLALRANEHGEQRSNPHHNAGYLIHPYMAEILANWI